MDAGDFNNGSVVWERSVFQEAVGDDFVRGCFFSVFRKLRNVGVLSFFTTAVLMQSLDIRSLHLWTEQASASCDESRDDGRGEEE